MMIAKTKIVITSLLVWAIIVVVHAFYSISFGLQNAGDGYDTEWQFQLFAFFVMKMPYYVLGLILFLIAELSLLLAYSKPKV